MASSEHHHHGMPLRRSDQDTICRIYSRGMSGQADFSGRLDAKGGVDVCSLQCCLLDCIDDSLYAILYGCMDWLAHCGEGLEHDVEAPNRLAFKMRSTNTKATTRTGRGGREGGGGKGIGGDGLGEGCGGLGDGGGRLLRCHVCCINKRINLYL